MRTMSLLVAAALAGCGVSTQEFDERTAELHRTERELAQAVTAQKSAERAAQESATAIVRATNRNLELERHLERLGVKGDKDFAALKRLVDAEAERAALAKRQAAERDQLQGALRDEIEAGVVRIEERDGRVRIVLPEEALFLAGGTKVAAPGKKILDSVSRELRNLPTRRLMIGGHTDLKVHANGLALSVERARQVADQLVKTGVDPGRIAVAGFAEYDPIDDPNTELGASRNRRVEIALIPSPDYAPLPKPPGSVAAAPPPAPTREVQIRPAVSMPTPSFKPGRTVPNLAPPDAPVVKPQPRPAATAAQPTLDDPGL